MNSPQLRAFREFLISSAGESREVAGERRGSCMEKRMTAE